MSKCRLCDQGHQPVINGSSVEHWIVKGIRAAQVTIKSCKEPEAAIARGILNISPPTRDVR